MFLRRLPASSTQRFSSILVMMTNVPTNFWEHHKDRTRCTPCPVEIRRDFFFVRSVIRRRRSRQAIGANVYSPDDDFFPVTKKKTSKKQSLIADQTSRPDKQTKLVTCRYTQDVQYCTVLGEETRPYSVSTRVDSFATLKYRQIGYLVSDLQTRTSHALGISTRAQAAVCSKDREACTPLGRLKTLLAARVPAMVCMPLCL